MGRDWAIRCPRRESRFARGEMADPCLTGDEGAGYQPGIGQLITGMDDGRYAAAVRTSCVVARS